MVLSLVQRSHPNDPRMPIVRIAVSDAHEQTGHTHRLRCNSAWSKSVTAPLVDALGNAAPAKTVSKTQRAARCSHSNSSGELSARNRGEAAFASWIWEADGTTSILQERQCHQRLDVHRTMGLEKIRAAHCNKLHIRKLPHMVARNPIRHLSRPDCNLISPKPSFDQVLVDLGGQGDVRIPDSEVFQPGNEPSGRE